MTFSSLNRVLCIAILLLVIAVLGGDVKEWHGQKNVSEKTIRKWNNLQRAKKSQEIINDKEDRNWELIETIEIEGHYGRTFFSKPTLHDSGDLVLAQEHDSRKWYKCDENHNLRESDIAITNPECISKFGSYLFTSSSDAANPDGHKTSVEEEYAKYLSTLSSNTANQDTVIYTQTVQDIQGNIFWTFDDTTYTSINEINEEGTILTKRKEYYYTIIKKDQSEIDIGPIPPEEYDIHLVLLSLNGKVAVITKKARDASLPPQYPVTSYFIILFYSEKGELINTVEIQGADSPYTKKFSDNGRFLIMGIDENLCFFRDGELILKKDVGRLGFAEFSEDQSMVIVTSRYVVMAIDTETGEIINSDCFAAPKGIANKGYPFNTGFTTYHPYVTNYESGEIMLVDEFKRFDQSRLHMQLSGDGKMLSVAYNNQFRKYRIGD
ncbi:MAG: hypothetical protein K9M99_10840 [Candidatus Cloacimonetes bacterium]|nr:hypothetical protein [Candidatus Cloacimonadota bacterium]